MRQLDYTPEKNAYYKQVYDLVFSRLNEMKPRNRYIILSRFGLCGYSEKTLKKLSNELAISPERVRQVEKESLRFLIGGLHKLPYRIFVEGKYIHFGHSCNILDI